MSRTPMTLLLLASLVGILAATTGCEQCDRDSFEESCDGDARVVCGVRRVRSEACGSGRTCRVAEYGYAECVDDSLTPCDSHTCSEDGTSVLRCQDTGYVLTSPCLDGEECTPDGLQTTCRASTFEPCTAPEARCTADGLQALICNPITGHMIEGPKCREERQQICASNGTAAGCVHESLEPCRRHDCAADRSTAVYCDSGVGYVTHKYECGVDSCFTFFEDPWFYVTCLPL